MNKKGFTLVELLATLVILGIVVGLTVVGININLRKTKEKTEEVFIGTIKDAIKMYMDSDARKLKNDDNVVCDISKELKEGVKVYKLYKQVDGDVTLGDIISSTYSPLLEEDLVNPNNEDVDCKLDAKVEIYRDEDYVYYYKMSKNSLGCLTLDTENGLITNLPDNCLSKIKD